MLKEDIFDRILASAAALQGEGAVALYVYGSRARGAAAPDSDLDVFVDFVPGTGFSLLELAGIKLLLEDALGLDVHVTTRGSLNPMLKDQIESEAVRVF